MKHSIYAFVLALSGLTSSFSAAAHEGHATPAATAASTTADAHVWVKAEVRKIDAQRGVITLRHEAIPNLSMDAMTMVFQVADRAMLTAVKNGDHVRFQAEKRTSGNTVVRIEALDSPHSAHH